MTGGQADLTLDLNGHSFHVLDAGIGPGVLLLHGLGGSSAVWREQVPALVEAGFRVVAPDLRGMDGTGDEQGNIGEAIDDLRGILRTLGVPRVHLVGQGRGAEVAWMFTNTVARRADRLVVIGSGPPNTDRFVPLDRPVMAIWGERDTRVDEATVLAAREQVRGPWRYERIADAGAQVPLEQPARLNQLLLEFLAQEERPPRPTTDLRAMVSKSVGKGLTERLRSSDSSAGTGQ